MCLSPFPPRTQQPTPVASLVPLALIDDPKKPPRKDKISPPTSRLGQGLQPRGESSGETLSPLPEDH